jgi:hypothetical protein
MAHFAKLNNNNEVTYVTVVDNSHLYSLTDWTHPDEGVEDEQMGIDFLKRVWGDPNSVWKQCSYNGNLRKNFPGEGFTYDESRDAFIPPRPYPSWLLNEATCQWEPPTPQPEEPAGAPLHGWDEASRSWKELQWSEADQEWLMVG